MVAKSDDVKRFPLLYELFPQTPNPIVHGEKRKKKREK